MDFPVQTIVFSLPSLAVIAYYKLRGGSWRDSLSKVGWRGAAFRYLAAGLILGLLTAAALPLLRLLIPEHVLNDPNLAASRYRGWTIGLAGFLSAWIHEALYTALGEEIFFRGLLGSMLIRMVGFRAGNFLQAVLFLLPHLPLLTVCSGLWPLLIVQLAMGWVQGWLLHRSGSILPGWISHSLGNAFGALLFMG
ncbi:MAG: CPBP family intramembrane metalloprotease [Anaerolineales bacterium]|nr:CPBP family intramembrane metalloprotease [Anaerolineales bacterium]